MTTKTATHTPGPWTFRQARGNNIYEHLVQTQGRVIAELNPPSWVNKSDLIEESEIIKANARLIAAAPDLLAALEKLVYCHAPSEGNETPERVKAWAERAQEDPEAYGSWRGETTSAMLTRLASEEARAAIAKAEGK